MCFQEGYFRDLVGGERNDCISEIGVTGLFIFKMKKICILFSQFEKKKMIVFNHFFLSNSEQICSNVNIFDPI